MSKSASADSNASVDDEAKTKLEARQSSFQCSWSATTTTLREALLRARLWFNMAQLASISSSNESEEEMDMRKRISEISKAMPAIVSTRKVNIFGQGNWYFLILAGSWWTVISVMISTYILFTALAMLMTLPCGRHGFDLGSNNTGERGNACLIEDEFEKEFSNFELLFWFSVTNIINNGVIEPVSRCAIVAWTIHNVIGIILNVLIFSIIVAKFLSPHGNIIFSKNALISSRNGSPVLLIRVGNLRCNYMLFPEIRLSLHRVRRTLEGESFVSSEDLVVAPPSTLSGSYSICHKIDEESPMRFLVDAASTENKKNRNSNNNLDYTIGVAVKMFDTVFQTELTSLHKYGSNEVIKDMLFGDIMAKTSDGSLSVDFKLFDTLKEIKKVPTTRRRRPSRKSSFDKIHGECPFQTVYDESLFQPKKLQGSSDSADDCDIVVVGGGAHLPEIEDVVVHICLFTTSVVSSVRFLGMKHKHIVVNLSDKPAWFLEKSEKGETPLVYIRESDIYLQSSEEINDYLDSHLRSKMSNANGLNKELLKDFDPIMPLVMAVLSIKNKLADRKCVDDTNAFIAKVDSSDCSAFYDKLIGLNDILSQKQTKFLLGDTPCVEDCILGTKIVMCMAILCVYLDDRDTFKFNPFHECTHLMIWLDRIQKLPMYDGLFSYPTPATYLSCEIGLVTSKFFGEAGSGVQSITQAEMDRFILKSKTVSAIFVSCLQYFALGDSQMTASGSTDSKDDTECPFQTVYDESLFQPKKLQGSSDSADDCDVVVVGGGTHVPEIEDVVVHICLFTTSVVSSVRFLGMKHKHVVVNLNDKPAWFLEKSEKGQTPLVYIRESDIYLQSSEEINDYLDSHLRSKMSNANGLNKELLKDFDPIMPLVMAVLSIKNKLADRKCVDDTNAFIAKVDSSDCSAFYDKLIGLNDILSQKQTKFLLGDTPCTEDCILGTKIVMCLAILCVYLDDRDTFKFNPFHECTHLMIWLDRIQKLPMYDGLFSYPTPATYLSCEIGLVTSKFFGEAGSGVQSMTQAEMDRFILKSKTVSAIFVSCLQYFALGDSQMTASGSTDSKEDGSREGVRSLNAPNEDIEEELEEEEDDEKEDVLEQLRAWKFERSTSAKAFTLDNTDVSYCL